MTELSVLTLPLGELPGVDVSGWEPEHHHRVDVLSDGAVLPFLVVPKERADHVLVLNNGAVDQAIAQARPVFQRSTWSREIRHHQIYFCDPGTVGARPLSLAWGQLDRDHWVVPEAALAVKILSASLGVAQPHQRTYFGSSAGGFMSLAMLGFDAGAHAVINNAQFDWTRWMATGVNPLRAARLDNALPLHLRQRHPLRTNVLNLLVKRNRPVRIDYHVNLASKHDREVDHPMFARFVRTQPALTEEVGVFPYEDPEAGHNPLSKERTLELVNGRPLQT